MLTRVSYLYMLLHVLLSFIARFGSLLASSLQACTDPLAAAGSSCHEVLNEKNVQIMCDSPRLDAVWACIKPEVLRARKKLPVDASAMTGSCETGSSSSCTRRTTAPNHSTFSWSPHWEASLISCKAD